MFIKLIIFSLLTLSVFNNSLPLRYLIQKSFIRNISANIKNNSNYTNTTINFNNSSNTTNITRVKIVHVFGDLYEKEKNQTLHLYVNVSINPYSLKNITLKERNNPKIIFRPETYCHYENNYAFGNVTSLTCDLNLTYVPKGNYSIYYFYYQNTINYDEYNLITIKEKEGKKENKTEKIELVYINSTAYENMTNQNITLFFRNNNTIYSLINYITIFNRNSIHTVVLFCLNKKNNSVFCLGDFSNVKSDIYNVSYLKYNNTIVNVSNRIYFKVYKNDSKPINESIKLLEIYGDIYTNETSLLYLVFNKSVYTHYFSNFFLIREKSIYSNTYNLNFSSYIDKYGSYVEFIFNFTNIPPGIYIINFTYKNKTYFTNITLNIKQRESLTENSLIDVYSNFKKNKNNQTAYFSFYGKNQNNNLAYIVLDDGYSRKNVIQTFDCKIVDENSHYFDLKCNLNLTYVNEGIYSVSEYYINNNHYYTKTKVDIVVK